ncbi:MAG: hypothetical protein WC539_06630 [Nitrospirota bacterium]
MNKINKLEIFILCFMSGIILSSCAPSLQLTSRSAYPTEITGTYTLILYGCRFTDDMENVAILLNEQAIMNFDVVALDAMYKVKKGVPALQALAEAEAFIKCSSYTVWKSILRSIDAGKGTIGYEMKALYVPTEIGVSETLLTWYTLQDSMITIHIQPDPAILNQSSSSGGGKDASGP